MNELRNRILGLHLPESTRVASLARYLPAGWVLVSTPAGLRAVRTTTP